MQTTADILQAIHRIVVGDTDYPSSGEDDYDLRLGLVNDYIKEWEDEEGTLWNELWKMASFSSTSASSYDLSSTVSDLNFPGGFVELVSSTGGSSYWDVKKLEDVRLLTNDQTPWCYFLGNPQSGFTIYFNPNCVPGSGTIKFPYYKQATQVTEGTDKPEMSDITYLIHMVASQVLSTDDPGESDKHFEIGQNKLRAMKTRNMMTPPWQSDRLEDKRGVGFGL